ncbi:MAG TPA: outer membrane beta-barrel protein [Bacteroidia bacterium]|nr:outer membrane beta-barrel protein [Bacteroidia bacterium]
MKTIINSIRIVLPLLFLHLHSIAQEKKSTETYIGIHGIPIISTFHAPSAGSNLATYKPAIGIIAGLAGQFNFTSRFALRVELNFEKNRYFEFPSYEGQIINIIALQPVNSKIDHIVHSSYNIALPVSMKFNFIHKEKINVFVNFGNYLNYKYCDRSTYFYKNGEKKRLDINQSFKTTNNYDPGLLVGTGADIRISKRIRLTMELRDQLNLTNVTSLRKNAIGILTGVVFKL